MKEDLISFETAKLAKEKGFEPDNYDGIERDEEQRILLGDAKSFSSYEEALEIGLQEALKLIK
jgi:hypothetical protein